MPIFLKEAQKDPAMLGSSDSETKRLKQLLVAVHQQMKQLTVSLRQMRSEKRSLEQKLSQKDHELKQVKQELQQLKQRVQKSNVGITDFGD